jgi:hypothetical protein
LGGSQFQAIRVKKIKKTPSEQNKLGIVGLSCDPSSARGLGFIRPQATIQDPVGKITNRHNKAKKQDKKMPKPHKCW